MANMGLKFLAGPSQGLKGVNPLQHQIILFNRLQMDILEMLKNNISILCLLV